MNPLSKQTWETEYRFDLAPVVERVNQVLAKHATLPITIEAKTIYMPHTHYEEFKTIFATAGWTVSLVSDQRDGTYWRFS